MQKPDDIVPLKNILKVTSVNDPAEPYQFKVFFEGKKVPFVWTLKAHNEASLLCSIACLNACLL